MLPKLSGLDVFGALQADVLVKHIPVVVLSGLGHATKVLSSSQMNVLAMVRFPKTRNRGAKA